MAAPTLPSAHVMTQHDHVSTIARALTAHCHHTRAQSRPATTTVCREPEVHVTTSDRLAASGNTLGQRHLTSSAGAWPWVHGVVKHR